MKMLFVILSLGFLVSSCNHVFYQPDSYTYAKAEDFRVPLRDLTLKTSDGESIHAWILNDTAESKGLILHFHGNAQNMTAHVGFVAWLADAGYTVVVFDYRGYGRSTGSPTQKTVLLDAKSIIDWIVAEGRWQAKPRIVLGQSLGGAIAASTLAENPEFARTLSLLVIESSFPSYRLVARKKLGQFWMTWPLQFPLSFLVSDDTSPGEAIKSLTMPKVIIHGDRDEVVPYEMGQLFFEAAAEPKEFWRIPFGQHTQAFYPGSPYREKLLERLGTLP